MKKKLDDAGYAGDADYKQALDELDRMFPGAPCDASMIEYLRKRERVNGLKNSVLKFALSFIIVVTMIGLLKFVFPVLLLLPALYFVMKKNTRPFPR